jgi:hypothetical protein
MQQNIELFTTNEEKLDNLIEFRDLAEKCDGPVLNLRMKVNGECKLYFISNDTSTVA